MSNGAVNQTIPPLEPEFVGRSRQLIVDGLLTLFDEVNATGTARWVSLEAPSGWGKTRVVREFYARLAAERQHEPTYWPATILGSLPQHFDDVSARRKQVFPYVDHVPGSLPAFFWWGIAASTRNGVASAAIAEDLNQLNAHQPYLDDVWRKLTKWSERHQNWWKAPAAEAAEEGITHLAGEALSALVGASLPGLGLVKPTLERIGSMATERKERRSRLESTDQIMSSSFDEIDATVALLTKLARPGLPAVIFVEDFHAADPSLAELLTRCAVSNASILIITTHWTGEAERHEHLEKAFADANDRLIRFDHERQEAPAPFPTGASLARLEKSAQASIVRFYYPRVDETTLAQLLHRYENPLALELFCMIDRYRRRFPDGHLRLPESELAKLPNSVKDLYRSLWNEMPQEVRQALTCASLGVPIAVGTEWANVDLTWHREFIVGAVIAFDHASSSSVAKALSDATLSPSWSRRLSHSLFGFLEQSQWRIAAEDDDFLFEEEKDAFLNALAATVRASLNPATGAPSSASEEVPQSDADFIYRARLSLHLHEQGRLDDQHLASAVSSALDRLEEAPRELPTRTALGRRALDQLSTDVTPWFNIRDLTASALLESGRPKKAISLFEATLTDTERILGPDHPDTLTGRGNLAYAYHTAGQLDKAIPLLETALTDTERTLGPDHPQTLTTRNNLAYAYHAAGQLDKAIPLFETALTDTERTLGPDHPQTLNTRSNLASAYQAAGKLDKAIPLYETTLTDAEHTLGTDHPDMLTTRIMLAYSYHTVGQVNASRRELETSKVSLRRLENTQTPHYESVLQLLTSVYERLEMAEELALTQAELTLWREMYGDDD